MRRFLHIENQNKSPIILTFILEIIHFVIRVGVNRSLHGDSYVLHHDRGRDRDGCIQYSDYIAKTLKDSFLRLHPRCR